MKKIFVVVTACLLCLAFSACSDKINIEKRVYQIDVPWEMAAEHQEQIILKDVEYTNSYYRASISGTLLYENYDDFVRYEINEQKADFRQVWGDVWSAKISVDGLGEITLYGNRLGDGYVSSRELQCDRFTLTAMEFRTYKEFSFLFYSDRQYLLFGPAL